MFLIAQKWRSSVVISTMRVVADEAAVRAHFDWLKTPREGGPWGPPTSTCAAIIYDTRYWFAWKISADAEPEICKDLLKEIR
jgi:hypothetical protein